MSLFLEDHKRITGLLLAFNKQIDTKEPQSKETFEQLHQALITHFHQEEFLYSNYRNITGEIIPVIKTIRKEHQFILKRLAKIKNSLEKGSEIDLGNLLSLLERHKNVEDRLLYPELDRILSDSEKEDIYWKIQVNPHDEVQTAH
jgi:hemerythrin